MQPSSGDTLDIKPLLPTGQPSQPEGQPLPAIPAAPEVAPPNMPATANDPAMAARARLQLAAMDSPAYAGHMPKHSPQPVSPVEEHHKGRKGAHYKAPKLPSRTRPIISAIASFLLLFLTFKAPVIFSQISYLANHSQQALVSNTTQLQTIPPDPTISIPKINVNAPVVYEPSINEAAIQKALQSGIVHYGSTPVPGEAGNAVFVGHSSNDLWEPGSYKFVFVLLDKLVVGDQFSINYNSVKYVYQVTQVKVVKPTDLSVLAPTSAPSVTLITCTPPGTSINRLVVVAKQISPDPGKAEQPTKLVPQGNGQILPSNPPGFFDQVKQLWHNLFGGGQQPVNQPQPQPQNGDTTLPGI